MGGVKVNIHHWLLLAGSQVAVCCLTYLRDRYAAKTDAGQLGSTADSKVAIFSAVIPSEVVVAR